MGPLSVVLRIELAGTAVLRIMYWQRTYCLFRFCRILSLHICSSSLQVAMLLTWHVLPEAHTAYGLGAAV